jgi:hypothetical protein
MSRDREVRFLIHYVVETGGEPNRGWTPGEWRVRRLHQLQADGKPTVENIQKHCEAYERSTQPGGCNSHLGVTKILRAWIVDQRSGETLADYRRVPEVTRVQATA